MTTIDNQTKSKFRNLVKSMDIPDIRRDPTLANLRWFIRNAWIQNASHRDFDDALDIARKNS